MSEIKEKAENLENSMAWMVIEINKIPKEYWPKLFEIIRLYGESVAMKQTAEQAAQKAREELQNPDPVLKAARQKALSELLRSWREEGDEQDQKETWEILDKALNEGGISI